MQYRWRLITPPTSVLHRHFIDRAAVPHNPEVSLSQICFIAPCNCYIFCPISLAPYLCFNALFQHFLAFHPVLNRAGTSWRICLVALHILTSCMQYSIQLSRYNAVNSVSYGKGLLTAPYTTSNASIFVISFVSSLRRNVSSTQK